MDNAIKIDHDLHIHSHLSLCSSDPEQTCERILSYAREKGLSTVCVTDHFWDEKVAGASSWYEKQNFAHVASSLPLPECEDVRFLFGCETELDKNFTLGIADETMEKFDFIIIPTTHLHMTGFTLSEEDARSPERRAELWAERFDRVLSMDLPFHKIGIAHLTCPLLFAKSTWEEHMEVLDMVEDSTLSELFARAAKAGVGIELNFPIEKYSEADLPRVMRIYLAAKVAGCKFYFGTDSHHPKSFAAQARFGWYAKELSLRESDKFKI